MLTAGRLREVLDYNSATGVFTWRVRLSNRGLVGSPAGELKLSGYILIGIDGQRYRAHRLAVLHVTGEWPQKQVDHRDTIRSHNWWSNLRQATNGQNAQNGRMHRDNTSGFKGVTYDRRVKKWEARIFVTGRRIFLGVFDAPQKAHAAYAEAAEKYFGEFARAA